MENFKEKATKWWKENQHRFFVEKDSGTWLHMLSFCIHALAKLTALIPNFKKKYKAKQGHLDGALAAQLEAKVALYRKLTEKHQDEHGFILYKHCDATLFSGLLSVTGVDVDLPKARDDKGFWLRNASRSCYPDGSVSSISRDMMLGVHWYLYMNRDLENAEKTYELYKKHNFVMGKGDPGRLLLMPSGEATLAEICHRLGGKNRWFARNQIQLWPKGMKDYPVHLLVMHGLLRGKMLGKIDSTMFEAFKHYAEKNPHNPVYNFAYKLYDDGDLNDVAKSLLNEKWWPNDRLPTRKDRHSDWITQREYEKDWEPGTSHLDREHPGGDFLVAAWLVLESRKGW